MHIQADHINKVVRLYDRVNDNPVELNIVDADEGRVHIGLEDRDSGNTELWITVTRAELAAALAVTEVCDTLTVRNPSD